MAESLGVDGYHWGQGRPCHLCGLHLSGKQPGTPLTGESRLVRPQQRQGGVWLIWMALPSNEMWRFPQMAIDVVWISGRLDGPSNSGPNQKVKSALMMPPFFVCASIQTAYSTSPSEQAWVECSRFHMLLD